MTGTNVTAWYRRNKDGEFEFNHFDYDEAPSTHPKPKVPSQTKDWSSGVWQHKAGILTDDLPAKLILVDNV